MIDVLELVDADPEAAENRSLALYKVLTADYVGADHSDVLKLIRSMNKKRREARDKGDRDRGSHDLFQEFRDRFFVFKGPRGKEDMPSPAESMALPVVKELGLNGAHALHKEAWAINRLLSDPANRPVHDMLMGYIDDTQLYRFILQRYGKDKIIRVRDLRALVSFVNMVKQADLSNPAVGLRDFMEEMGLREAHGMPVQGKLATMSQDGVRVFTAHSSKGLEFYSVFMPFCLQNKSWPNRGKPDIIPLPAEICRTRERADEDERRKELKNYDELRLFYVASTRAKAHITYTATPEEKVIVTSFLSRVGMEPRNASPKDEESFLAAYLKKEPERDALEGTNEVLKDIVSQLTLNPTSLNNYMICRRKFLYDNVLMLPEKKNQQLTFGNCAHKALEEVYTAYMDKRVFPAFKYFREAFLKELRLQGVNDTIKKWCVDRLGDLEEWYASESASPVMPLDLENTLEITIGDGILFRGTFDKVEGRGSGEIRVVDYKTGKPDDHIKAIYNYKDVNLKDCDGYFRQLVAYKMLYDRSPNVKVKGQAVEGVLHFLEPATKSVAKYGLVKGQYVKYPVELSEKLVSELERLIVRAWKEMQDLKFERLPERDDRICGRCDFDGICWG
jgi:CRISPR/Cas system-associated exonuclease Cas4 (RecB family)